VEFDGLSFTIRFPTNEEEERRRRFRVLRNYLVSLDDFLHMTYGDDILPGLLAQQRGLRGYGRIHRQKPFHPDHVRRYLTLSWAAELQLRLAGTSFPSYSNAWAPVHAYYAVCMALNAWFAASLLNPPSDHSGTLNMISSKIKQTSVLPLPWSVACVGCPPDHDFKGLPAGADPSAQFELLANPDPADFWPRYCKFLKTTREFQLERVYRGWKRRHNRKHMYRLEKEDAAIGVSGTTVFDWLYRLRFRANYRDVETMLMSSVDEEWHGSFFQGLLTLTTTSCLLLESLLLRSVGTDVYRSTMDDFLDQTPVSDPDPRSFLEERRHLLIP